MYALGPDTRFAQYQGLRLLYDMITAALLCSVVSDCLQPHGLYPTSLLCPWNFPGKSTGAGCQSLLQWIFPNHLLHWKVDSLPLSHPGSPIQYD